MSEWIDVNERLPPKRMHVIVYGSTDGCSCGLKNDVFEAKYDDGWFEYGEYGCPVIAKAWMPLPAPPEDL